MLSFTEFSVRQQNTLESKGQWVYKKSRGEKQVVSPHPHPPHTPPSPAEA